MPDKSTYLGDGLYAEYDGYSIWLKANHHKHPTDKVCLEPAVLVSFIRFASQYFNLKEIQK